MLKTFFTCVLLLMVFVRDACFIVIHTTTYARVEIIFNRFTTISTKLTTVLVTEEVVQYTLYHC